MEPGLSCRSNQVMVDAVDEDGDTVYCCKPSQDSKKNVPEIIAQKCDYRKGELLSWSGHTPGTDLTCADLSRYEIVTLTTTHLSLGKQVTLSCCKKIETTTTEGPTTTTTPLPTTTSTTMKKTTTREEFVQGEF